MTGPRRNRVDPFGDLHAVPERGMFTGNRGCLVGLARPGRWTPVFFPCMSARTWDDAVALAAGHRPCGECRHAAYRSYRDAVSAGLGTQVRAGDLNRRLRAERLHPGRGLARAADRRTWTAPGRDLPDGTVVVLDGIPRLAQDDQLLAFTFAGWGAPVPRPEAELTVLTPPTSVTALRNGFRPELHRSVRVR